jgi:hypothetical protein
MRITIRQPFENTIPSWAEAVVALLGLVGTVKKALVHRRRRASHRYSQLITCECNDKFKTSEQLYTSQAKLLKTIPHPMGFFIWYGFSAMIFGRDSRTLYCNIVLPSSVIARTSLEVPYSVSNDAQISERSGHPCCAAASRLVYVSDVEADKRLVEGA